MSAMLVKGWCPGALRPMESGDGLIVRLKPTGGIVPVTLAAEIAAWSACWGNGQIDLTNRANLQLRGVAAQNLPHLRDALATAGLLDAHPDGEAVRNVVASPLAGLDPDAILDIRPIVANLEARLAVDPRLRALPSKFGLAVDDGGQFGPGDMRSDIRFEAQPGAAGPIFAIFFDGGGDQTIGSCNPDDLAEVAALLSGSFLADQQRLGPHIRRLPDVVAAVGVQVLAGRKSLDPMSRREFAPQGKRRKTSSAFLGVQPLAKNSSSLNEDARPPSAFVGVALPFGRMSADAFSSLAENAIGLGAREFRLTSWRAILVPVPTLDAARKLAARLPTSEFILRPEDPRRRVVACVGAPACLRGTTDVRTDATRMAAFVPDGAIVHVSGCAKGCAHPRAAAATLVGRNGLYDLVRHGAPWDEPVRTGMSATEAAEQVRYLMEGIPA